MIVTQTNTHLRSEYQVEQFIRSQAFCLNLRMRCRHDVGGDGHVTTLVLDSGTLHLAQDIYQVILLVVDAAVEFVTLERGRERGTLVVHSPTLEFRDHFKESIICCEIFVLCMHARMCEGDTIIYEVTGTRPLVLPQKSQEACLCGEPSVYKH